MAVVPVFVIGPNTILSLIGHIRGPKPVQQPDPAMIRELDVDVVIPAYNERATIALCLASVMRQTMQPNSVTVIDDGSDDDTAAIAQTFAAANNFAIRVIRRRRSIGKTPGLKIESRNLEGDVEFILDADTVLMSDDYIENVVTQLWRVPGIAAASGMVYPLRDSDRTDLAKLGTVQRLVEQMPNLEFTVNRTFADRVAKGIGIFYRDAIYQFMQAFFYRGVQNLLGSMPNPVGCAVAYRREYLRELFDQYEPAMGDNMTSSEDIFFGTAFIAHGYHNIQNTEVVACTEEPMIHHIPRQLVKWSSAWLQSAYYLPEVVVSPFRVFKRYQNAKRNRAAAQKRRVVDGYRQPFGRRFAHSLGRPGGWMIFCGIFEKITLIMVLSLLMILGAWWFLFLTILFETTVFTGFLVYFSPGRRIEFLIKGVLITPFRYAMLATDLQIFARFLFDLLTFRREWRK